ncbi:MAG: DUF559 domain-containing protein [Candidatus Magasanikbacteria bacterium]|jgi:very-short-patch-repair endonuclease|nr:DUF559 domain-containing protein [Candidatus Magasanikbacteria bacterium]MBT4314512.1 DUF559 domain-containing protein [Candidatus Magasanikbacteria bacterium]MBT4547282.1 DUF559 domain-containing protein [Candidatus Magasanikbacteria bacterium]MBT6818949.1 DUF559 domain-containing protein [Candidatus Magasanikbacteria bacterium]
MSKIFNQKRQKHLRKELRGTLVKSEAALWKKLRGSQIGFKFRRQHGIWPYIVDFYCPRVKLVVEIDGYTHIDEEDYKEDLKREKYLRSLDLNIKRYSSGFVLKNIKETCFDIYGKCVELKGDSEYTTPPLRVRPSSERRGQI